jgi:hypothetical protein
MRLGPVGCVVAVWIAVSCNYDPRDYRGDGVLTSERLRSWPDWASYSLDLGAVDLSRAGTRRFSMARLPAKDFHVGIAVAAKDHLRSIVRQTPLDPSVAITIRAANGAVVCEATGHLTSWEWSWNPFEPHRADVWPPAKNAASCWRFRSSERAEYRMELAVTTGDPAANDFDVRLRLAAGAK